MGGVKSLLSEIADLKKNAGSVKNIGAFSDINAAAAYAARSEVAGDRNTKLLTFTYGGADGKDKSGFIINAVAEYSCAMQILFADRTIKRRNVTGCSGVPGAPTNAWGWEEMSPTQIDFVQTPEALSVVLKSYEGGIVTEKSIPAATTSAAGIMTAADKQKLNE